MCRHHACYREAILGTTPALRESHSFIVSDLFRKNANTQKKVRITIETIKCVLPFSCCLGGDDGSMLDEVMEV